MKRSSGVVVDFADLSGAEFDAGTGFLWPSRVDRLKQDTVNDFEKLLQSLRRSSRAELDHVVPVFRWSDARTPDLLGVWRQELSRSFSEGGPADPTPAENETHEQYVRRLVEAYAGDPYRPMPIDTEEELRTRVEYQRRQVEAFPIQGRSVVVELRGELLLLRLIPKVLGSHTGLGGDDCKRCVQGSGTHVLDFFLPQTYWYEKVVVADWVKEPKRDAWLRWRVAQETQLPFCVDFGEYVAVYQLGAPVRELRL